MWRKIRNTSEVNQTNCSYIAFLGSNVLIVVTKVRYKQPGPAELNTIETVKFL